MSREVAMPETALEVEPDPVEQDRMGLGRTDVTRFGLVMVGLAALAALFLVLVWYAADIFLLTFAGILLAVFLRGLSDLVSAHTGLRYGWSLAIVVVALLATAGLTAWLLAGNVVHQVDQLTVQLPVAVDRLEQNLERSHLGRQFLHRVHQAGTQLSTGKNVVSEATSILSQAADAGLKLLLVVFVGLYGAITPQVYVNGLVRLVPIAWRRHAHKVARATGVILWWWLVCRVISMAWVGLATMLGLWLLGVPLALTLGLLAGLLKFVPYIGPILSAVPAALLALVSSPMQAVYVVALYFALEMLDDHVILPLLQWRTLWLPPALALFGQVLLGVLCGPIGVLFAMPLTAVALVLVKMLYVEDILGDTVIEPGAADREPKVVAAGADPQGPNRSGPVSP